MKARERMATDQYSSHREMLTSFIFKLLNTSSVEYWWQWSNGTNFYNSFAAKLFKVKSYLISGPSTDEAVDPWGPWVCQSQWLLSCGRMSPPQLLCPPCLWNVIIEQIYICKFWLFFSNNRTSVLGVVLSLCHKFCGKSPIETQSLAKCLNQLRLPCSCWPLAESSLLKLNAVGSKTDDTSHKTGNQRPSRIYLKQAHKARRCNSNLQSKTMNDSLTHWLTHWQG